MNRPTQSSVSHPTSSVNPEAVVEAGSGELAPEVEELRRAIEGLDVGTRLLLQPLFQKVCESSNRRRKILQMVQESIGQLRLDMKYLVFDLEATRRERDELEQQVGKMMGDEDLGEDQEGMEPNR